MFFSELGQCFRFSFRCSVIFGKVGWREWCLACKKKLYELSVTPVFYFKTSGEIQSTGQPGISLKWPIKRCVCFCQSARLVAACRLTVALKSEALPARTTVERFEFRSEELRRTVTETQRKERTLSTRFTRHKCRHVTRRRTTIAVNNQVLTSLQPHRA